MFPRISSPQKDAVTRALSFSSNNKLTQFRGECKHRFQNQSLLIPLLHKTRLWHSKKKKSRLLTDTPFQLSNVGFWNIFWFMWIYLFFYQYQFKWLDGKFYWVATFIDLFMQGYFILVHLEWLFNVLLHSVNYVNKLYFGADKVGHSFENLHPLCIHYEN